MAEILPRGIRALGCRESEQLKHAIGVLGFKSSNDFGGSNVNERVE